MHQATATLKPDPAAPVIHPNIYGHFAEHLGRGIYEGLWVGEDSPIPNEKGIRKDVVAALKNLDIPVLRWPGGCFADEYHWKDGVGPRETRKSVFNTHWGGVVENNHFGTHEFFTLCEQLGCATYVCGNVGSGTVQEMQEWVEYMTSPSKSPMADWRRANGREEPWKLDFFGVGNESWGCGGNMFPEYYADEYRRYNTFVRTYGDNIYRIACGANTTDYRWTEVMMDKAAAHMDGLSLHYYTLLNQQWPPSGTATVFEKRDWYSILKSADAIDGIVQKHSEVMDAKDPEKRIGMVVDEWGTWYPSEKGSLPGFLYQQNTIRDALVAAVHFHIFHRHADRVTMTNIAQMVNVLQAMVLTDGPRMLLTPTYHVFEMFKHHQGGKHIPLEIETPRCGTEGLEIPAVSISASQHEGEGVFLSAACQDAETGATVTISLGREAKVLKARILTAETMQSHNTFDQPEAVKVVEFTSWEASGETLALNLPARSVVTLKLS